MGTAMLLAVVGVVAVPALTAAQASPRPVSPRLTVLALPAAAAAARRRHGAAVLAALPQTATAQFQTVAVTWLPVAGPALPEMDVDLRLRADGRWGRWVHPGGASVDGADGSEGAAAIRQGTKPYFAGPSDGVQVRVTGAPGTAVPAGLRVDLIDPGASPADAAVTDNPTSSSAYAAAVNPRIITRAQWGADNSLRNGKVPMTDTYQVAFVHHTAGTNNYSEAQGPAQVRGLYAYYVNSLGYSDMGYNFLVDRYGNVYEGRTGSLTTTPRSAATGGFNTNTFSVAALGNFQSAAAPDAMVRGIGRVIGYRLAGFYRNPTGRRTLVAEDGSYKYPVGARVRFPVISGHRTASATSCPGNKLALRLPAIRRVAKRWMGANLVEPRVTGRVTALGSEPRVQISAGVLRRQRWRLTIRPTCGGPVIRTLTGVTTPGDRLRVRWRGRDGDGRLVPAGRYVVRLQSWAGRSRSVPWATWVDVGQGGPGTAPRKTLSPPGEARFVPLTPTRIASTATGQGLDSSVLLGPGDRVDVPVLGRAGVPSSGVAAVAVQVQVLCASSRTSVSALPGRVSSGAAVVSGGRGQALRGTSVVAVGPDGSIGLRNAQGAVSLAVDLVGYWTTSGSGDGYQSVARQSLAPRLRVGTAARSVQVTGRAGVPTDATAVLLNVRQRAVTKATRLTVWPDGASRPPVASMQTTPGAPTATRVLVRPGTGGRVQLQANAAAQVGVDVVGYFSASASSGYHAVTPRRLGRAHMTVRAGRSVRFEAVGRAGVPDQGAKAVVLQLAGTASRSTGVTVWPAGSPRPGVPDLLLPRGGSRANLAVVPLTRSGALRVATARGRASVTVRIVGWVG